MSAPQRYQAPPRVAERLLARMFPDQGRYSTLGDLAEVYNHLAETHGVRSANAWYWMQWFRALGPFFINVLYWGGIMFRNYVISTARHLRRHKVYTAINVFGLAVALSFAILVYFFVRSETTYDQFHPDYAHIYRASTALNFEGLEYWENTPFPLAEAIREEVPGIAAVARFVSLPNRVVQVGREQRETSVHLASPSFFEMFHFPLEAGDPSVILNDPQSVIISPHVRETLFGGSDPVGADIQLSVREGELESFTVAGVARPFPENSSITFDYLLTDQHYRRIYPPDPATDWFPKGRTATFLRTRPEANFEGITAALNRIAEQHRLDRFLRGLEVPQKIPLERLDRVHFSADINNRILRPNGDPVYVYILSAVALLVLLIACINFMNLSVGMAATRVREIGLRKVLGAVRGQLMRQFWFESLLLTATAFGLGLALAYALLPTFNGLAGTSLALDVTGNLASPLGLLGLMVLVGLAAGTYPALVLSGFRPVTVLKGRLQIGRRNYFSLSMVVLQLAISIFFIASTLIMARQLRHVSTLDLGYQAELLLMQQLRQGADEALVQRYRQAALQHPNVVGLTGGRITLLGDEPGSVLLVQEDDQPPLVVPVSKIDFDFLEVMGIELADGRNFSPDFPSDAHDAILVNEAFVRHFQLEDPVGQPSPFDFEHGRPTIVGVVKDYHFMSLRQPIGPLALYLRPDADSRQVITKIRRADIAATLAFLRETWQAQDTGQLFNYTFLDEAVGSQYQAEQNFHAISTYASWLAILIASLGLFGMTALSVARRTKEMGIRKVLGASSLRILLLFNKEYLYLLLIAHLVACPVAYYVMQLWLNGFAYRLDIAPWLFVLAGLTVSVLAVFTITARALRMAHLNPVDTLRYE